MNRFLAFVLIPMLGFSQTVYTGRKGDIPNGNQIVTNVTFEGLATVAYVAPIAVVATNAYDTATNALEVAQTAYNRPSMTTNDVNSLSSVIVSNHNLSASAHEDIRADVSNAVDLASWAVKTNSVGGLAIGGFATSSGVNSFSGGYLSEAYGYASFVFGDHCSTVGEMSFAIGNHSMALHDYSFVWSGYNGISSHGLGTFNIDPFNGASGFYIGETNLQTFLDEKLSIDHENESSAHGGRITALEARPTGLTTNTVFPFMMLSDDYSTNGVVRVAVSNGVFSIWGMK